MEQEIAKIREQARREIESAGKIARHELTQVRGAGERSVGGGNLKAGNPARRRRAANRLECARAREGRSLSSQTVARRYASALADVIIERNEEGAGSGGVGMHGNR